MLLAVWRFAERVCCSPGLDLRSHPQRPSQMPVGILTLPDGLVTQGLVVGGAPLGEEAFVAALYGVARTRFLHILAPYLGHDCFEAANVWLTSFLSSGAPVASAITQHGWWQNSSQTASGGSF